ncbi:MAG: triose-phosphate isomerase family protein [Nakamurella sp.]
MLPNTLIGCSSKSYLSVEQARRWGPAVLAGVESTQDGATGLFICPSFPLIPILLDNFATGGGLVGAQDVSIYPTGPYTGEVNAQVLADLGSRFVMAGHPERRRLFGESAQTVQQKVKVTADAGMAPIIVVGEAIEGESAKSAVSAQLETWLPDFPFEADLIVAYEPAWAIGQPQPAPPGHVAESIAIVRELLEPVARHPRVLYGGSAQQGTFSSIAEAAARGGSTPDGLFMARAGLDPDDFLSTVREIREVVSSSKVV